MTDSRSVLTIGNFDGIHIGHRKLLTELKAISHKHQLPSVLITYDRHPKLTLKGDGSIKILTPDSRKQHLLESMGIDQVKTIHFDRKLAEMSAYSFLRDWIIAPHHPEFIVVGYDSHFGHRREGTFEFLKEFQDRFCYEVIQIDPEMDYGVPVSSTMIRGLLSEGDLGTANRLLGKPYRLYGNVIRAKGIGTALGFPTANLELFDANQLLPKIGVYLSQVLIRGKRFFGLTNIGYSPTLKTQEKLETETYIMDFNDQIDGEQIALDLVDYLRPEIQFRSEAQLQQAMRDDLIIARARIKHVSLD